MFSGGIYGSGGRLLESIIFIDYTVAASEVFQRRVLTKDTPLQCSELQRSTVSVSLCCVTNHPQKWHKTMIIFSWFFELAPRLPCLFCRGSLKQLPSAGGSAGLKVKTVGTPGLCDRGCWLLAGVPHFSPTWPLIIQSARSASLCGGLRTALKEGGSRWVRASLNTAQVEGGGEIDSPPGWGRVWNYSAKGPGHWNGRNLQSLNSIPQWCHRRIAGPRSEGEGNV